MEWTKGLFKVMISLKLKWIYVLLTNLIMIMIFCFRLVLQGTFIEVGLQILMETCNIAGRSESVFSYRKNLHFLLILASLALMVWVHCHCFYPVLTEFFYQLHIFRQNFHRVLTVAMQVILSLFELFIIIIKNNINW